MEQEHEGFRSRFFLFRGTHENTGRHAKSLSVESANVFDSANEDDLSTSRSQGSTPVHNNSSEKHQAGPPLAPSNRSERAPKPKLSSKDDDLATEKEAREKMALGSCFFLVLETFKTKILILVTVL